MATCFSMLTKKPQNMVFLEKMQATFDIIELLGLSPVLAFVDNIYESAELWSSTNDEWGLQNKGNITCIPLSKLASSAHFLVLKEMRCLKW